MAENQAATKRTIKWDIFLEFPYTLKCTVGSESMQVNLFNLTGPHILLLVGKIPASFREPLLSPLQPHHSSAIYLPWDSGTWSLLIVEVI